MPEVILSLRFKAAYRSLPKEIRIKVQKALRLLAENPAHPSLRSKPIQGIKGVYEISPDRRYRITYERLPGDLLLVRVVGIHDDALKNP